SHSTKAGEQRILIGRTRNPNLVELQGRKPFGRGRADARGDQFAAGWRQPRVASAFTKDLCRSLRKEKHAFERACAQHRFGSRGEESDTRSLVEHLATNIEALPRELRDERSRRLAASGVNKRTSESRSRSSDQTCKRDRIAIRALDSFEAFPVSG